MFARSVTIEAQQSCIDVGIAYIRDEAGPALQANDGYIGMSLLVARDSGRCIATSAWTGVDAMQASEPAALAMRTGAAAAFAGRSTDEQWEIAALHRAHHSHPGACVRATWLQVEDGQLDRCVEFYRTRGLPPVKDFQGFCSASLLIDRASGRAVTSVTFDTREAMERAREQARSLRDQRMRELGAEQLDVREFELAVAQLRVPEIG